MNRYEWLKYIRKKNRTNLYEDSLGGFFTIDEHGMVWKIDISINRWDYKDDEAFRKL